MSIQWLTRYTAALVGTILLAPQLAVGADFDQSFLHDYTKLQARDTGQYPDYVYKAPDLDTRLPGYRGVALDQPEILISADSEYKGAKPDDLAQIAEHMRTALSERLTAGGYTVADAPGPGIIFVRLALTDLEMKKKKRPLLAYTPVGAVVKAGVDSVKDAMDKVDITHMVLQGELLDGETGEVLVALVVPRGTAHDEAAPGEQDTRMDFDQLTALVNEYGARLRCGLDNTKLPEQQRIDCLDVQARAAREAAP